MRIDLGENDSRVVEDTKGKGRRKRYCISEGTAHVRVLYQPAKACVLPTALLENCVEHRGQ